MGILEEIKNQDNPKKRELTEKEAWIKFELNKLFYLDKNIEKETEFIKHVMTRGQETQKRKGLHASEILQDNDFCYRRQVLSSLYERDNEKETDIGLKRIFEEGNAVHEKWQRLFIRGGLCEPKDCDMTMFEVAYNLSYTPDIKCIMPDGRKYVVEIKSANTYQFKKMEQHPKAYKQLQLYMYLTGIYNGFVLCEDKNTQEFSVECYEYDGNIIAEYLDRLDYINEYAYILETEHRILKRHEGCISSVCKMAMDCPMRNTCYKKQRVKINESY